MSFLKSDIETVETAQSDYAFERWLKKGISTGTVGSVRRTPTFEVESLDQLIERDGVEAVACRCEVIADRRLASQ